MGHHRCLRSNAVKKRLKYYFHAALLAEMATNASCREVSALLIRTDCACGSVVASAERRGFRGAWWLPRWASPNAKGPPALCRGALVDRAVSTRTVAAVPHGNVPSARVDDHLV